MRTSPSPTTLVLALLTCGASARRLLSPDKPSIVIRVEPAAVAATRNDARLPRRAALASMLPMGFLAAGAANPPRPADAFVSPLLPLSLVLRGQKKAQLECFEQLECADAVPYYDIECERGDTACLERKQRLARSALADQGLQGPLAIAAVLLLPGPLRALTRAIATAIRRAR